MFSTDTCCVNKHQCVLSQSRFPPSSLISVHAAVCEPWAECQSSKQLFFFRWTQRWTWPESTQQGELKISSFKTLGTRNHVTHAHCVRKWASAPHTLWSQFPADAIIFCFLSPVPLSPPFFYPADWPHLPTNPPQHRLGALLGSKSLRCMQR